MNEKKKILWISFHQKQLLTYKRFFSVAENFLNHEIIAVKVRGVRYFSNIFFSLFTFFWSYDLEKFKFLTEEAQKRGNKRSDFLLRIEALFWIRWAENVFSHKHYDAIILWGGLQIYQIAVEVVAKEKSIPVFFMENGYMPNTTQFEKFGTNWGSSLKDLPKEKYMSIQINYERMDQIYLMNLVPRERRKSIFSASKKIEANIPEFFCFLPFQVSKDSQIQLYSPWISTMPELVNIVNCAISCYNQRNKVNLKLVIKEHPSDYGRVDYEEFKHEWENMGILIINSVSTEELIEKSRVVVTINSSVGVESLIKKKPVIILGDAAFHQVGITQKASNTNEIIFALENMGNYYENDCQRDHFLYYLSEMRLVKGHWKNSTIIHWRNVERKIQELMLTD